MSFRLDAQARGPRRFHVVEVLPAWPHERMVLACETKREAELVLRLLGGDRQAACAWYRLVIERASRSGFDLRYAVHSAHHLGLRPHHVRADPSGRPLEWIPLP